MMAAITLIVHVVVVSMVIRTSVWASSSLQMRKASAVQIHRNLSQHIHIQTLAARAQSRVDCGAKVCQEPMRCLLFGYNTNSGDCFSAQVKINSSLTGSEHGINFTSNSSLEIWTSATLYEKLRALNKTVNPVYILVSQGKPTSASSVSGSQGHSNAVDGKGSNSASPGGLFHSAGGDADDVWWMVNLEATYQIHKVRVWNRWNNYGRLRFYNISVGVTVKADVWTSLWDWKEFLLCSYYEGPTPSTAYNPIDFPCNGKTGQFVTLRKFSVASPNPPFFTVGGTAYQIHVHEVQVFAEM